MFRLHLAKYLSIVLKIIEQLKITKSNHIPVQKKFVGDLHFFLSNLFANI